MSFKGGKNSMAEGPIKPFLRWAGGKSLFVKSILERLPSKERIGKYYEPFLGAGSVFLAYQPKATKLSDLNKQLIDTFAAIKENPRLVYRYLRELASEDSERNYYKIRDQYNHGSKSMKQAARFIYLNKTCFNGIFRVNTEGKFNVPYGYKKKIMLPSTDRDCFLTLIWGCRTTKMLCQQHQRAIWYTSIHHILLSTVPPTLRIILKSGFRRMHSVKLQKLLMI